MQQTKQTTETNQGSEGKANTFEMNWDDDVSHTY